MPYSPDTYKALIQQVGEGGLADRLLDKWLSDDETGLDKFVDLANDMYRKTVPGYIKQHDLLAEEQPQIKRWRVVLWYYSIGYSRTQVAEQLDIGLETVKEHLRIARRELGVARGNVNLLVTLAIRQGFIP